VVVVSAPPPPPLAVPGLARSVCACLGARLGASPGVRGLCTHAQGSVSVPAGPLPTSLFSCASPSSVLGGGAFSFTHCLCRRRRRRRPYQTSECACLGAQLSASPGVRGLCTRARTGLARCPPRCFLAPPPARCWAEALFPSHTACLCLCLCSKGQQTCRQRQRRESGLRAKPVLGLTHLLAPPPAVQCRAEALFPSERYSVRAPRCSLAPPPAVQCRVEALFLSGRHRCMA